MLIAANGAFVQDDRNATRRCIICSSLFPLFVVCAFADSILGPKLNVFTVFGAWLEDWSAHHLTICGQLVLRKRQCDHWF